MFRFAVMEQREQKDRAANYAVFLNCCFRLRYLPALRRAAQRAFIISLSFFRAAADIRPRWRVFFPPLLPCSARQRAMYPSQFHKILNAKIWILHEELADSLWTREISLRSCTPNAMGRTQVPSW